MAVYSLASSSSLLYWADNRSGPVGYLRSMHCRKLFGVVAKGACVQGRTVEFGSVLATRLATKPCAPVCQEPNMVFAPNKVHTAVDSNATPYSFLSFLGGFFSLAKNDNSWIFTKVTYRYSMRFDFSAARFSF
jgi:hypothetical protein